MLKIVCVFVFVLPSVLAGSLRGNPPNPPSPPNPPPSSPSLNKESNTCASHDCGHYIRGKSCQCNEKCKLHNNCCADYDAACTVTPPNLLSLNHESNTCASHDCGHYVRGKSCQCNEKCKLHNNCCAGYDAHCTVTPPNLLSLNHESNTCASHDCGHYVRGKSCQCNEKCKLHNNCCADYDAACTATTTTTPSPSKNCNKSSKVKGFGGEYWSTGYRQNLTVYHQTSSHVCDLIMASNFRPGSGGLCGAAMYFALSPEATSGKAITAKSHGGCMIEAVVDVGSQGFFHASDRAPQGKFQENCGGWNGMTAEKLHGECKDTILMSRDDGNEVIVFEPERILSKKIIHFQCGWMCRGECQKEWPAYCHRQ